MGSSVALQDSNFKYSIKFDLVEPIKKYSLKLKITFISNSDHILQDLSDFNCASIKVASLFKDDLRNRTWEPVLQGKKTG